MTPRIGTSTAAEPTPAGPRVINAGREPRANQWPAAGSDGHVFGGSEAPGLEKGSTHTNGIEIRPFWPGKRQPNRLQF